MIICHFNVIGITIDPFKTNSPLVVYTYAVLTLPVTFQCLQSVTRWNSQVIYFRCSIKNYQFFTCNKLNIPR